MTADAENPEALRDRVLTKFPGPIAEGLLWIDQVDGFERTFEALTWLERGVAFLALASLARLNQQGMLTEESKTTIGRHLASASFGSRWAALRSMDQVLQQRAGASLFRMPLNSKRCVFPSGQWVQDYREGSPRQAPTLVQALEVMVHLRNDVAHGRMAQERRRELADPIRDLSIALLCSMGALEDWRLVFAKRVASTKQGKAATFVRFVGKGGGERRDVSLNADAQVYEDLTYLEREGVYIEVSPLIVAGTSQVLIWDSNDEKGRGRWTPLGHRGAEASGPRTPFDLSLHYGFLLHAKPPSVDEQARALVEGCGGGGIDARGVAALVTTLLDDPRLDGNRAAAEALVRKAATDLGVLISSGHEEPAADGLARGQSDSSACTGDLPEEGSAGEEAGPSVVASPDLPNASMHAGGSRSRSRTVAARGRQVVLGVLALVVAMVVWRLLRAPGPGHSEEAVAERHPQPLDGARRAASRRYEPTGDQATGVAPVWCTHQSLDAVELKVCQTEALWSLDAALNREYARRRREGGSAALDADQRAWLASRAACMSGRTEVEAEECIRQRYQARVEELAR